MARVDVDGVGIEYEVTGEGPPVVLLHGFPDSGQLWRHQVPALVLAGELDILAPPRMGRIVAERIPHATFEIMPGEAHQPFQESPDDFNARVDEFWRSVDGAA